MNKKLIVGMALVALGLGTIFVATAGSCTVCVLKCYDTPLGRFCFETDCRQVPACTNPFK